jgi:CHAT domain-containing protein/predicted negative regulator of RcsB-dependent stress response
MLEVALFGCGSPKASYHKIKKEVDAGEYDSALTHVESALRRDKGASDEWAWRLRVLKARILVSRSQCKEALATLDGNLPDILAATDVAEQQKLYQGIAHRCGQHFPEAERDFEEAAVLTRSLSPVFKCQLLIAKAALEFDEKKYEEAETSYKSAQSIAHDEKFPDLEANALGNLARLATGQRHFDQAVDMNQSALELSHSLGRQGDAATILGNIAWAYSELGDFDRSLDYFRQGAEASAKSGLPGYSAYWFAGVANSYLALRDYAPAEQLALKTLQDAYQLKNAQTTTECLNTLAEVMLRTDRLSEAKRYNQEALNIEGSGSDTFGVPDSLLLAGHIAATEKRFGDADQFFHRVLSGPSPDAPLQWEAESALAGVRDNEGKPVEAERLYLQAIGVIEKARQSINHDELRLSFLSSGIAVYGKYIDFLVRHNRPADALNQAELSRARTLAEGLSSDAKAGSRISSRKQPQQLAQRLHATLLVYWLGEEHSYLWVITPAKTTYFTLPPAAEIDALVKAYTQAIVDSKDVLDTNDVLTGEKLYATLIAPAQKFIPANSRVILLPDGTLYGLNLETLIAPEPRPHYWIEDVTLTTGSSLTLLTSAANRPGAKGKNLLLVGDPKEANPEFPRLLQAPNEMKKVEQHFQEPQRVVLEGERATPSSYLISNPGRFSYVHFATHGTASRTRPLESAVVLSKEPGGDTYKLYARDIVTRQLKAELVTISACYGSGRRAYSGEGLVGLSWAFLRAGAHNVIGALWEVSDVPATPELMDALYRELGTGKDPAAALRDAKLSLLHSNSNTVFKKPFYWAPFQLYAGS